ncbi:Putative aliphatic sulfonates transport permease protein SsuC [Paraliobacillus sp. PM-2]|uniref:ABC transporter permease n=1 Tax=Paraliobacillus sp. PM-2 TaxID=1462524 RepID=UPI00061C127B|nr:ABC transporter permease [Paraliobacillus sp. PM-2]CQR47419.1 Putative aliphatic sulfonates transport permease protein SsuC [Paraliobacillus sp. PM-2]
MKTVTKGEEVQIGNKIDKPKRRSNRNFIDRIPNKAWLGISLLVAIMFWTILSVLPSTSRSFPNVFLVAESIGTMIERGVFTKDFASSLISILSGFGLGFVLSLPIAILMAWYRPVRFIIEPWIQFIRNIPPLAYVPLVVISAGVGRTPQIIVITIATFLTMTITIYQGVRNIDQTLIKAARVLGAKDKDIFLRVIAPASLPFIMTAIRLGTAVALTSLIAAESTGASAGLGMRIRALSNTFESSPMLLYIIIIGIIGLIFEKLAKVLERRLTGWQDKVE